MTDDESRQRCDAWRARHAEGLKAESTPESDKIAADLPIETQRAMTKGPPWALKLTPVIAAHLELFDLLDLTDRESLSDLGIAVLRSIWAWDSDYSRREKEFDEWFAHHYRAAQHIDMPGHEAAHAACYMDPDAHDAMIDIAAKRDAIIVAHRDDIRLVDYLEARGLVTTLRRKGSCTLTATQLGRDAAFMLNVTRNKRAKLFEGARQSPDMVDMDRKYSAALESATRVVGGIVDKWDQTRRFLMLMWIAGRGGAAHG